MRTISWKDLLMGVFVAAIMFMLMGATTAITSDTGGNGRYAVAVGGSNVTYSVCVTDTWTGETRCQQGGGPKEHSFSPGF